MEKKKKSRLVFVIIILLLIIVGVSFAYYFAMFRGQKENIIKTATATIIYSEQEEGLSTTKILSEEDGIKQADYYEFSIKSTTETNSAIIYGVYFEEIESNTLDKNMISMYITNEKDVALVDEVKKLSGSNSYYNTLDITGKNKYYETFINNMDSNGCSKENLVYINELLNGEQKFRIRYWVSNELYGKDADPSEVIISGNTQSTQLGVNEVFKFKISVYGEIIPY